MPEAEITPAIAAFIGAVDQAYRAYDDDHALLNRSLALSSDELGEKNRHLMRQTGELADSLRRIEQLQHQLDAILRNLADGVLAVDPTGRIEFTNPALLRLLDRDALDDASLPEALASLVGDTLRSTAIHERELPLPNHRTGVAVASPIRDQGSDPTGAVVLLRDITHARQVDRMKTDFIATVSHELRTPLTSVVGFAKITRARLEQSVYPHVPTSDARAWRVVEQVRGNLDIMVSESERLTALINDVLDIEKMEAGRVDWHPEPLEPRVMVERAVAATAGLFSDGSVRVVVEVSPELPRVRADAHRLHQVLLNLLSNAAKFTPEGVVRVGARKVPGGFVEFDVVDTGEGIAPEDHQQVFEKFRQVGDTLVDKPGGTGLGLPICRHIVEHHGGRIWVESALGQGSRFVFVLPHLEAGPYEPLTSRLQHHLLTASGTGRGEILIVDDDEAIRELVAQQLAEDGYPTRRASGGEEALAAIRERKPDLVILDLMMPGMNGLDVVARLRADPDTRDLPVVMLSILELDERGYRVGVDRYLTKPVETDELLATVSALLDRGSRARRVLVVDDDLSVGHGVARALDARGMRVVAVCRGQDCLERARSLRPDLILVERPFPELDDVVRQVRSEPGLEHTFVLLLVDPAPASG